MCLLFALDYENEPGCPFFEGMTILVTERPKQQKDILDGLCQGNDMATFYSSFSPW